MGWWIEGVLAAATLVVVCGVCCLWSVIRTADEIDRRRGE